MDENLKKEFEKINKIYLDVINNETTKDKEQIELFKESFDSAKSSMSNIFANEIPNSPSYIDMYSNMAKSIMTEKNLSNTTKNLLSFTDDINKEKFKYDIDQLNKIEPKKYDFPNYGEIITDSLKHQRDSLILVVNHLEEHNSLLKKQIENNNLASKNIIEENKKISNTQIELLKEQIIKSDHSFTQQLKDSRISMKWTIGIAVVSIAIAIWSINKTEEIYNKENNSSDIQHSELIQILQKNTNKTLNSDTEQLKVLNKILESLNEQNTNKDKNITK